MGSFPKQTNVFQKQTLTFPNKRKHSRNFMAVFMFRYIFTFCFLGFLGAKMT
jgi:hypothetical protein